MQVKGFAPRGCPLSDKLTQVEYKAMVAKLLDLLPESKRAEIRPAPPFALNYQITLRVSGGWERCQEIRDLLNVEMQQKGFTIKDKEVRAVVEMSPRRRAMWANVGEAEKFLRSKGLTNDKYEVCSRSLKLFSLPGWEELGCTPVGSAEWAWVDGNCRNLGIDLQGWSGRQVQGQLPV